MKQTKVGKKEDINMKSLWLIGVINASSSHFKTNYFMNINWLLMSLLNKLLIALI